MARSKQTALKATGAPQKKLRDGVKVKEAPKGGIKKKPLEDKKAAVRKAKSGSGETGDDAKKKGSSSASKARAYRRLARLAGYTSLTSSAQESAGTDAMCNLVSVNDAARLMRYNAASTGCVDTYDKFEIEDRKNALSQGAPLGAAKAVAIYTDAMLRSVVNDSVRRAFDSHRKTTTASDVLSVLRPMLPKLQFSVGPLTKAHMREAQRRGLMPVAEEEKASLDAESKALKALENKRKTKRH